MGYKVSSSGNNYLNKISKNGKDKSLILPSYNPPLQILADFISIILIISIIPLWIYVSPLLSIISTISFIILFGLREFFFQDDHALIRIYGPLGRIRYIFEDLIRDKYLQYFNESNTDGRPIPRIVRDYIYQKAHNVKAVSSFGTELDNFDLENSVGARLLHRNFPPEIKEPSFEVIVGEKRKNVQPFKIKNTINISAMSYGSLNYRAAEALSIGTKDIAYLNSGEGGFGPHGVAGNDVVFQIGTGKFGIGKDATLPDGRPTRILDDNLLKNLVKEHSNIKMLQIKISQGAKPGLGGVLPGTKVTPEIAEVRKVKPWTTIHSPPQHTELIAKTSKESILKLMDFIDHLRNLSGLPVGIKLCVGHPYEIDMLVEAMKETSKGPDAIQVDGKDGGTGAAPNLFLNYMGFGTAVETVFYLDKKLKQANLRDTVTITASGKMFTPAHAAVAFASGADAIDTARGAMLALGCIQALKCHTNHCPTGITTNSPWRVHGLDIPEKSTRIHHFLKGFHEDMMQITKVMGHSDPRDIKMEDLRIITFRENFAAHFEEDPFGLKLETKYKI